jgi:hypothetical protein
MEGTGITGTVAGGTTISWIGGPGTGISDTVPGTGTTVAYIGGPGTALGADAFPAAGGFQQLQPGDMGYLGGLEGLVADTLGGHAPAGGGTGDPNAGLGALLDVARSQGDQGSTIFAPSGTHVEGGLYVDESGHAGDISHVQPDFNDPNSNHVEP